MEPLLASLITLASSINANNLPKASFDTSLTQVLKLVFMASALLSVIFVAFGGLKYVLSSGDPQGAAKAKNTILYALIGLIIAVSAFSIVSFVASRL